MKRSLALIATIFFTPTIIVGWETSSRYFTFIGEPFPIVGILFNLIVMWSLLVWVQVIIKTVLFVIIDRFVFPRIARLYVKIAIVAGVIIVYTLGLMYVWHNYFPQGQTEVSHAQFLDLAMSHQLTLGMSVDDARQVLQENGIEYVESESCGDNDFMQPMNDPTLSFIIISKPGCLTMERPDLSTVNFDTATRKVIFFQTNYSSIDQQKGFPGADKAIPFIKANVGRCSETQSTTATCFCDKTDLVDDPVYGTVCHRKEQ